MFLQGLHNRLQNEKARLATAIQACESASASISRPSSPLDEAPEANHKKENEAKQKLEDLIDQVRVLFFIFEMSHFVCFTFVPCFNV